MKTLLTGIIAEEGLESCKKRRVRGAKDSRIQVAEGFPIAPLLKGWRLCDNTKFLSPSRGIGADCRCLISYSQSVRGVIYLRDTKAGATNDEVLQEAYKEKHYSRKAKILVNLIEHYDKRIQWNFVIIDIQKFRFRPLLFTAE